MKNEFTGVEDGGSDRTYKAQTVRMVGHSICEGTAPFITNGLARKNWKTETSALSSTGIQYAISSLKSSRGRSYDAIIVNTGINDWSSRNAIENLGALLDMAKNMCVGKVYVFNIVEYDNGKGSLEACRRMNRYLEERCASEPGLFVLVDANSVAKKTPGYNPKVLHGPHDAALYKAYADQFLKIFNSTVLSSTGIPMKR